MIDKYWSPAFTGMTCGQKIRPGPITGPEYLRFTNRLDFSSFAPAKDRLAASTAKASWLHRRIKPCNIPYERPGCSVRNKTWDHF